MSIFTAICEFLGRMQAVRTAAELPQTRLFGVVSQSQRGEEIRMRRLEGKVTVITGGISGIGLATAKKFAEDCAKVAISGRDPQTLEKAAKDIDGDTLAIRANVADPAALDRMFHQVKARFGGIDVLFVNAGVAKFAPLPEATPADFNEVALESKDLLPNGP